MVLALVTLALLFLFSRSSFWLMSHKTTCPLMHPPATICGSVGLNLKVQMSSGASRISCGWIGSEKLQMRIKEGVIWILDRLSILSSWVHLSPYDTPTTPEIKIRQNANWVGMYVTGLPFKVGCQSIAVTVLFLLFFRSVKLWYS